MDSLNIAVPTELQDFVQQQVASRGYRAVGDYVCDLIRNDQRRTAQLNLEAELLKGLDSGPMEDMTSTDWEELRENLRVLSASRSAP